MLSVLVENDKKYKDYAYKICGCHDLKHDLVNDMYLKLDGLFKKNPEKTFSNRFVFLTIRSIFLNIIRNNNEVLVDEIPNIPYEESEVLCERITIDEVLSEMSFFDREILLKAQEKSFRKIGLDINCHHSSVSKMYTNSLDKAKELCQQKGMQIERSKAKD